MIEQRLFDAFISHSSTDAIVANKLAQELKSSGISVWIDNEQMNVGDNIVSKINFAIAHSRFVIVLLSSSAIASRWVEVEWTAAHAQEIESQQTVVLPAIIDDCDIPMVLKTKLHANLTDWKSGRRSVDWRDSCRFPVKGYRWNSTSRQRATIHHSVSIAIPNFSYIYTALRDVHWRRSFLRRPNRQYSKPEFLFSRRSAD